MSKIPIGVQLYSVRKDCERDLPGTLKAIAEMGYSGVDFAGYYDYSAAELRKMLDDLGLKCCGTHIQLDTLLGDALPATAEFNLTLGNKYLVVPWLVEKYRDTSEAWKKTADLFSEIADRLKTYDLLVGYHNHSFEFEVMDGKTGFEWFYDHTGPTVIMQIDTGNAVHGGGDPVYYLKRYKNQATTVHLKEYSASNPDALIGEGDTDWQAIFDICDNSGKTDWYIVEQESYPYEPVETIRRCLAALRGMGK